MKFMFLLKISFYVLLINGKTIKKKYFHDGPTDIFKICPGHNCDENLHETERNVDYQIVGIKNRNKIRAKRANSDSDSETEPKPIDNVRRGYKYLTKEQIEQLEDYYQNSGKPKRLAKGEIDKLAKRFEMESKLVKRWFTDRRHNEQEGS